MVTKTCSRSPVILSNLLDIVLVLFRLLQACLVIPSQGLLIAGEGPAYIVEVLPHWVLAETSCPISLKFFLQFDERLSYKFQKMP
jgi:hypothetical protein